MAVLPINSVSVNTNNYAFTGKSKKEGSHNKANALAGVPIVVMLAMSPSVEGKQPAQFMPVNSEQLTELVAQVNAAAPNAYEYAQAPQSTKSKYPLGVKELEKHQIQHIHKGKGNGVDANFVFCSKYNLGTLIDVAKVFYIDNNFINKTPNDRPPIVTGLVYHNIGKDKEFCSVKVISYHPDKNGKIVRMLTYKKIDDETAQLLIDLLAGDTKWNNNTDIKFFETDSPRIGAPKVLD